MGKHIKSKQWKNGGEEDKLIIRLMKQGKITKFTKPATLKSEYPHLFNEFTSNVVRNHLNALKRTNGLYLADSISDEELDLVLEDDEGNNHETAENSHDSAGCASIINSVNNVHHNYPFLCETFKDPDNQFEKVIMVVAVPGGAQTVKVELNDDGTNVFIKYSWPKTMFHFDDLYKTELAKNQFSLHHPKVLILKTALEKVRKRIDASPESLIDIPLPIKVQTSTDSFTHSGVLREDGTKIITAEFKGFIKDYNKKSTDSTVTFNI